MRSRPPSTHLPTRGGDDLAFRHVFQGPPGDEFSDLLHFTLAIGFFHVLPGVFSQRLAKGSYDPFTRCGQLSCAELGDGSPLFHVKRQTAVEEHVADHHGQGFTVLAVLLQVEVLECTRASIETGWDSAPGGHQQMLARHDEITLSRQPALGLCCRVRLGHDEGTRLDVLPDHVARGGMERIDVDAFRRPDTRGEVHRVLRRPQGPPRAGQREIMVSFPRTLLSLGPPRNFHNN